MTAPTGSTPLPSRTDRLLHAPRSLTLSCGYYDALLWVLALAAILVTVPLVIAFSGPAYEGGSALRSTHHVFLWAPFGFAILLTGRALREAGDDRARLHRLGVGAVAVAVVTGLVNMVLTMVLLFLERAVYARLGWFHGMPDGSGVDFLTGNALTYGAGLAVVFIAGPLSGVLVGAAYHRLGPWWGTAALPATLAPILLVAMFGLAPDTQYVPLALARGEPEQARALVSLGVLVAAAAVVMLFVPRASRGNRSA